MAVLTSDTIDCDESVIFEAAAAWVYAGDERKRKRKRKRKQTTRANRFGGRTIGRIPFRITRKITGEFQPKRF